MHDVCAIHFKQNSVHGHPKLLVVKWLGLSVTVRVRVRIKARDSGWIFHSLFCFSLSYKWQIPLSYPPGLRPGPTSVDTAWQYD